MNEEILQHIVAGRKVLVRVMDAVDRKESQRSLYEFARNTKLIRLTVGRALVMHDNGGYVHFAIRDDEIQGREYHVGLGMLTEMMRTRVRL